MHVRSLTWAVFLACTPVLFGGPSFARDVDPATAAAIAKAKLQLLARAEQRPAGTPGGGSATGTGSDPQDPVAQRLEAVFSAILPPLGVAADDADRARLPRPRPAAPESDVVALAYAAEPTGAARASGGGLSAIEALVEKHAEANNVPAALAQALVQIESTHNPRATGRNGEIGLLQIKPQTARAMGYKGSAKGLYDPDTNLAWGMKYLGRAHELAGGDLCGTLLRFNAGLDAKRQSAASNKFCAKVKKAMAQRA